MSSVSFVVQVTFTKGTKAAGQWEDSGGDLEITNGTQLVKLEKDPHVLFAFIFDGKILVYALEDDVKHPVSKSSSCLCI